MQLPTRLQPARRVRQLRVRATNGEDACRMATLLNDALSTASLPGAEQGRFIVIRRLPLGRVPAHVSAAVLALHLERIAREVSVEAVSYHHERDHQGLELIDDLPGAESAGAVSFADRATAIVALARRHARRERVDAWYWAAAVSQWSASLPREERWTLLLNLAHELPGAPVLAAAIVREAVEAGVADEVLRSVSAAQAARWLRLEGWTSVDTALPEDVPLCGVTFRELRSVRGRMRDETFTDNRVIWLATMVAVGENPLRAADPLLPARIARVLAAETDRPEVSSPPAVPDSRFASSRTNQIPASPQGDGPPQPLTERGRVAPRTTRSDQENAGEESAAQEQSAPPLPASHESDTSRSTQPLAVPFTEMGGLFFVVPILQRLGFDDYLASRPQLLEIGFPVRLFHFIGARAGLRPDDPMVLALACDDGDISCSLRPDDLPVPVREVLASPPPRISLDSPFDCWLTAVRRWSRRHARMGLVTLCQRPARLHVSATHFDLCFDLSQLDIRVRRVALDVDPGWVPWLGRVVRFIYEGRA